jgi:hypothetical protein
MTRAGTPAATVNGGTGLVTAELAPMNARSPTSAMTVHLALIVASSPMRMGRKS